MAHACAGCGRAIAGLEAGGLCVECGEGTGVSEVPGERVRDAANVSRLLAGKRAERERRGEVFDGNEEELVLGRGLTRVRGEREPWFYRLLTLYASGMVIVFFAGGVVAILGPVVMAINLVGGGMAGREVLSSGLVIAAVLMGVLIHAALVFLMVDAGRNLRQINMRMARREWPEERR